MNNAGSNVQLRVALRAPTRRRPRLCAAMAMPSLAARAVAVLALVFRSPRVTIAAHPWRRRLASPVMPVAMLAMLATSPLTLGLASLARSPLASLASIASLASLADPVARRTGGAPVGS